MLSESKLEPKVSINSTDIYFSPKSKKESLCSRLADKIQERIEKSNYTDSSIVFVDVTTEKDTTVAFPNRVLVTTADAKYLYQTVGVLYRCVYATTEAFSFKEKYAIKMVTRDGNSVSGVDYREYYCNREEAFYETEETHQKPVKELPSAKGDMLSFPFPTNILVSKTASTKKLVTYTIHGAVLCLNAGQHNHYFENGTDSFHLTQDEVVAAVGRITFRLHHLTPFRRPTPVDSYRLVLSIIHRFSEIVNQPINKLLFSKDLEPLCNLKYHAVDENGSPQLKESLKSEFYNKYNYYKRERGNEYESIYTVKQDGSVFHMVLKCEDSWVFVGFCLTEKWIVVNDPCYQANRSLAAASGILHFIHSEYKTFNGR
jgi:hypothetical protein